MPPKPPEMRAPMVDAEIAVEYEHRCLDCRWTHTYPTNDPSRRHARTCGHTTVTVRTKTYRFVDPRSPAEQRRQQRTTTDEEKTA